MKNNSILKIQTFWKAVELKFLELDINFLETTRSKDIGELSLSHTRAMKKGEQQIFKVKPSLVNDMYEILAHV